MKKLLAISLALILALGMVSIAAAEDVITIGFAQVGHESDWRAANTLDYQNTFTAENGYELLFVDADNDHTAQMEAVRNFIQQEVDYIVICPVQEAGWDVVLQEAQDAGIPVIIADRTVSADPSLYSCFIGTDSKAEGVLAGQWLAETLDGAEANILVIEGSVGASAAIGRTEGFNEVVAEHPEWKVLDSQSGDFTQAGGQQVMESYLKSYPDQFNVVVCQNDNEAYGAIDAMKAAGVTYGVDGDVILISFDATKQGLTLTRGRDQLQRGVQPPAGSGRGRADRQAGSRRGSSRRHLRARLRLRCPRHRDRAGHHHDPGSAGRPRLLRSARSQASGV